MATKFKTEPWKAVDVGETEEVKAPIDKTHLYASPQDQATSRPTGRGRVQDALKAVEANLR